MAHSKLTLPSVSRLNLSQRLMIIGIGITIFWILIAFLAPILQTIGLIQDPTELLSNNPIEPPSISHWFGTNLRGYDVFSRTLLGSQAALKVVFLSTILSMIIGVPLGLISGYLGGKVDRILLFLMDTIYTIPGLLLSITLAFVLGRGILNVAIAVSISYIPQYYRIVRNHTTSVKNELFIEAAKAMGATSTHVLSRYLFFNVIQSVPVLFTLNAADAILVLGGLGFLGLGLPEEVPEWGHDLKEALSDLSTGVWWTTLFPGLGMTLMVVGLSFIGEGISEMFNPTLRNQRK
ncbi:binding protein dependent transport systems inner membrane component [Aphanothece sacrum FPU1]|uniref:Binding protein dependent transport systems inner membrane component n=2 Tax=Aphanothece sacrum TaxID=1122 RepID=A0A401IKT6_APHSA|nr:ABC transporter permease [Aphanothece sacrum]GBF81862.1 binding protein dependent transport systems inner membrane component [Aphanothece sacrum FPU1]GBF85681.1 transport system inner membrane protein [Aphanothece sacrum FPU3]